MKNILAKFNDDSIEVIKELTEDNKKFTGLIEKLQNSISIIENKVELSNFLTQKIKK